MEINFVLFVLLYERYKTKFPTKISSFTVVEILMLLLPRPKKGPSWWCIKWYRRIYGRILLLCINAWCRGSQKSRLLAVPQLNQTPWFLDTTRSWFYASAASQRLIIYISSMVLFHIEKDWWSYANFSASTFEPAHVDRARKRAALSVYLCQLQLRCSNLITGLQARSSRCKVSAKWAKNVIAFCGADRNLSSKRLARYIQGNKRKS